METVSDVRTEPVSASKTGERIQAKPYATRIWDALISIKLAIWTLILLAVTSILGTVIEQNQLPAQGPSGGSWGDGGHHRPLPVVESA